MTRLNLPMPLFKTKRKGNNIYIFDELRKKYILLTPEEWVRQHVINYLIEEKKMPKSLISVEGGITTNTLKRRYDCVVFDRSGNPLILVECKATSVKISQKTFDQAFAYNVTLKARYILISNGLQLFFCSVIEGAKPKFMNSIPNFCDL